MTNWQRMYDQVILFKNKITFIALRPERRKLEFCEANRVTQRAREVNQPIFSPLLLALFAGY